MYRHNHTGELTVRESSLLCKILLNDGSIVNVQSDNPDHFFGSYLISKKIITRRTLDKLLPRTGKGNPLGAILETQKNLPRQVVHRALIDLHAKILSKTLTLTEGAYSLNEVVNGDIGQPLTSNANLIFHAGRYLDDEKMMMGIIGGEDLYLVFARDPLLLFQELILYPEEFFFISRLQNFTRVSDYFKIFPEHRRVIIRMLFGLVSSGILELVRKDVALEEQYNREEHSRSALEILNLHSTEMAEGDEEFCLEVDKMMHRVETGDFYRILDIPKQTTQREIREKFLQLAKTFHPDQANRKGCLELKPSLVKITTVLRDAYETLSNPEVKPQYDKHSVSGQKNIGGMSGQRQLQLEIAQQNYEKALDFLSQGENYLAYELLSQSYRFDPRNRDYIVEITRLEIQNSRWLHRAVQKLSEYLEVHPDDGEMLILLGDVFKGKGMKSKAREFYQRALKGRQGDKGLQKKIKECSK